MAAGGDLVCARGVSRGSFVQETRVALSRAGRPTATTRVPVEMGEPGRGRRLAVPPRATWAGYRGTQLRASVTGGGPPIVAKCSCMCARTWAAHAFWSISGGAIQRWELSQ